MTTTGANVADVLPEPANGTKLVRVETDGVRTVIWRDDDWACRTYPDERWLSSDATDPMEWREILRYATAVHAVSAEPLATMPAAKANA